MVADPAETGARRVWTAARWRRELGERRDAWRNRASTRSRRPALSMARRVGLLALRAYIVFAVVIMVIKLVQVTAGH